MWEELSISFQELVNLRLCEIGTHGQLRLVLCYFNLPNSLIAPGESFLALSYMEWHLPKSVSTFSKVMPMNSALGSSVGHLFLANSGAAWHRVFRFIS